MMKIEDEPKPDVSAQTCETCDGRRSFLTRISLLLSGFIGLAMISPIIGFVLAPVLRKPRSKWRSVGRIEQFSQGSTTLVHFEDASTKPWAGVTGKTGAWLRRKSDREFIAFSINCRHLGCPVRWVEGARLFMCPCHGGVYYEDGSVAAGPPPKPLEQLPVRMRQGDVEIKTTAIPLTLTKI